MNKILYDLDKRSGIYMFVNVKNGKRYIGSSKGLYDRLHEHVSNLSYNKSHNKHFQAAWNKYGEDAFIWTLLEYCDESVRFEREQYYIDLMHPEYNFSTEVVANFGRKITDEEKAKISNTLKKRYASGEIKTYRQDHAWVPVYVYDIQNLKHVYTFSCIADAIKSVNLRGSGWNALNQFVFKKRYIFCREEFTTKGDLKNYIYKKILKVANFGDNDRWLIVENNLTNEIQYFEKIRDCAEFLGISKDMIRKNHKATQNNPYLPNKAPNYKVYYVNEFIPYIDATPIEKSLDEKIFNIGESCDANTEITEETKESSASYSVETEPEISE